MTLQRVLVANRGEIAVRIARTLRRLGIESAAVYSDADRDAPHVHAADRAVRIGPAPTAASYLDVARVVDAALSVGADAIHPGYGFLSERPELARACREAGLVFVGPSPEAMALLGDKVAAKQAAIDAGVPVVPGLHAPTLTDEEILAWAEGADARLPLMVKAAAGGGGKGMRIVRELDALPDALGAARREARAAFGDDRLLVEHYVERPRHIEVQVIADEHGTVLHLGERECSLQRRHQKVIEEAPSPVVTPELRARMGEAAASLARGCGYTGAGTVELIAAGDDPADFAFLEMNARLQVEHPVTEAVTGLDLVELQLRVAAGEPLGIAQSDVALHGHAVEARVYAEDPDNGFLPSTGRLVVWTAPRDARVDSGVIAGSVVTSDYDPMLAKVIVHAGDRAAALRRMERALGAMRVAGPTCNVPYLRALVARPEVRAGELDTGLLARLGSITPAAPYAAALPELALVALLGAPSSDDPWQARDAWRPGGRGAATARLEGPDGVAVATAEPDPAGGWRCAAGRAWLEGDVVRLEGEGGVDHAIDVARDGDGVWLVDAFGASRWTVARDVRRAQAAAGALDAPMPGVVLAVRAEEGAEVRAGDVLVLMESMKMELSITSPADGVVRSVGVREGQRVAQGEALVEVEPA